MEELEDIRIWEETIKAELSGLTVSKASIEGNSKIPAELKSRSLQILQSLKLNMLQILTKCQELSLNEMDSEAFHDKYMNLKKQYTLTLKSLRALVENSSEPKKQPALSSILASELEELKEILLRVEDQLQNHTHDDLVEQMARLQHENSILKSKLSFLQEEHAESLQTLYSLKYRMDALESGERSVSDTPSSHKQFSGFAVRPSPNDILGKN